MCKVKGCSRPQFVGGMCGFHALQGYYAPRTARTPHGPRLPAAGLQKKAARVLPRPGARSP